MFFILLTKGDPCNALEKQVGCCNITGALAGKCGWHMCNNATDATAMIGGKKYFFEVQLILVTFGFGRIKITNVQQNIAPMQTFNQKMVCTLSNM